MPAFTSTTRIRVRYSEIDALGTYYNSRALEWFEVGRGAWLREAGLPYGEIESRGVYLPIAEAHVRYLGRATFDDELALSTTTRMESRAAVRFDVTIAQAEGGAPVASGYTIHAFTNITGKPMRPPAWFLDLLTGEDE